MPRLKEIIEENESKSKQKSDLDKSLFLLQQLVDNQQEFVKSNEKIFNILEKISEKEYPKFPEIPKIEFPKIQKVEVQNPVYEVGLEKPDWYKEPNFDLSGLRKLEVRQDETNQLLVAILASLKDQLKPEELEKGIIASISSRIGVRRNLGKLFKSEIPRGNINGENKDFYLMRPPFAGFLLLTLSGQPQTGEGEDYTLTGNHIAYKVAPVAGPHRAVYF